MLTVEVHLLPLPLPRLGLRTTLFDFCALFEDQLGILRLHQARLSEYDLRERLAHIPEELVDRAPISRMK